MTSTQLTGKPAAPRAVVVYRDRLLHLTERFVASQAECLVRYRAEYAGSRLVSPSVALPPERTHALGRGRRRDLLPEVQFRVARRVPRQWRHLRLLEPALVHAHFSIDGVTALPLARWLDVPLVVTFHGSDITGTDEAAAKGTFAFRSFVRRKDELAASATRFLAVSRFIAERAVSRGFPRERITVHHIGVDTTAYRPADVPIKNEHPLVVFVGRLVFQKGAADAIDAIARLPVDLRVDLVIAGDGPERTALERMAGERRISCSFAGHLSRDDVGALLQRSDVVVVPSRRSSDGKEEGFGLAASEAQACGVPVVAYRTGGLAEAVEEGRTGLLVREGDVDALARAVESLIRDPELRRRMGHAARARSRAQFDLATQTAALEDIYDDVVGSRDAAGDFAFRR